MRTGLARAAALIGTVLLVGGGALAVRQQGDAGAQQACQSNLKELALGVLMYVQDYDERFPPMKAPLPLQHRVYPYTKNPSIFKCPATGVDYLPNPALNYVYQSTLKAPASTVMLRDAKPHTEEDGKPGWNAAYADGHVHLARSEPALGKPAPTPPPPTRAEVRRDRQAELRRELAQLKGQRRGIDEQIRKLQAQIDRL